MYHEVTYTGMDGREHTETHHGNEASKDRLVMFLEERGAQCVSVEPALWDTELSEYKNRDPRWHDDPTTAAPE